MSSSASASVATGPNRRPIKPPVVHSSSVNSIIINPCQRLNPLLECIRNVSKEFGDIIPDFQLGRTTCALFLSLKYHRLHPEYIHQRIQKLGNMYNLRLLLVMCDVSEHQDPIRALTKICLINNMTVIVCWSNEEAGMYLSTYKAFEQRPPDLIKERVDKEHSAILRSALTSINKVNKMDVETLRMSFGSFAKIAHASPEKLRILPGFGQIKVRRVVDAFEKPFRNKATSALPSTQAQTAMRDQDERGLATAEYRVSSIVESSQVHLRSQRRGVHQFGSAADVPTTMPTPAPVLAGLSSSAREPSPPWDIELDLNDDALNNVPLLIDPRLSKKGKKNNGESSTSHSEEKSSERNEKTERHAERPSSPVWDIELDVNNDD